MLKAAHFSSSSGPPSCPAAGSQPGDPGSLPKLKGVAAAFPFADKMNRQVQQMLQRHAQKHLCSTLTQLVTQTDVDKMLHLTALI